MASEVENQNQWKKEPAHYVCPTSQHHYTNNSSTVSPFLTFGLPATTSYTWTDYYPLHISLPQKDKTPTDVTDSYITYSPNPQTSIYTTNS